MESREDKAVGWGMGFVVISCVSCMLVILGVSDNLFSKVEVAEMSQVVQEVSCKEPSASVESLASDGALVHLRACDIGGAKTFSWSETSRLSDFYAAFKAILPAKPLHGTYVYVSVEYWIRCSGSGSRYNDDCPCSGWGQAACWWRPSFSEHGFYDLFLRADNATVGVYPVSDDVANLLPGEMLALQTAADYKQEDFCQDFLSFSQGPAPSAHNMRVGGDGYLYTNTPPFCQNDVRIGFFVGSGGNASALGALSAGGRLQTWNSKVVKTAEPFAYVLPGPVSAQAMIGDIAEILLAPVDLQFVFLSIPAFIAASVALSCSMSLCAGDREEETVQRGCLQAVPGATGMFSSAAAMTWLTFWYPLESCGAMVVLLVGAGMAFNGPKLPAGRATAGVECEPLLGEEPRMDGAGFDPRAPQWVAQALALGAATGAGIAFPYMMLQNLVNYS